MERLRIAYITDYDSSDLRNWSGLGYYIQKSLSSQGAEIIPVNCHVPFNKWQVLKAKLLKLIFKKRYELERDHKHLKLIAAKAEKELQSKEFDLIFSPGSLPITYLSSVKPIVFWTDATYDSLLDFYHSSKDLLSRSIVNGNKAEQLAINKASLIFYSSEWSRNNAINKYEAQAEKVIQLPFGANIEHTISMQDIQLLIAERLSAKQINLLFIGVDWVRKGGNLALETVLSLRKKGYSANLNIVGCQPPQWVQDHEFVSVHSFISKSTKEGADALADFYRQATFFILPSHAECTPVVFSEAASYGLPIITTNVGGLTSVVKSDEFGYCLDLQNFSEIAAGKIISLYFNDEKYKQFSLSSFYHFQNELNWNKIGEKALAAIRKLLAKQVETSEV